MGVMVPFYLAVHPLFKLIGRFASPFRRAEPEMHVIHPSEREMNALMGERTGSDCYVYMLTARCYH